MFDGRFRPSFEKGLKPVGANLRRAGIKADHLTAFGVVMSGAAAVAIANGALRGGLLLLALTAIPDVLDGAVAKASGTASPRGAFRSEEHTSELQSLMRISYAVFCLKKKKYRTSCKSCNSTTPRPGQRQ